MSNIVFLMTIFGSWDQIFTVNGKKQALFLRFWNIFSEKNFQKISSYLRAFRAVMVSTCGIAPGPSWEQDIADFKTQFLAAQQLFGLKETPKIHIILQHIPDFIR